MKGSQELEAGDKYQMVSDGKRRTLVIKSTELKDEGGYVVVIGSTRASAELTVLGKPRLHFVHFFKSKIYSKSIRTNHMV